MISWRTIRIFRARPSKPLNFMRKPTLFGEAPPLAGPDETRPEWLLLSFQPATGFLRLALL